MAYAEKHERTGRDDISETASSRAEVLTLNSEDLPRYEGAAPASAPADRPAIHGKAIPTIDDPFVFPPTNLPSYTPVAGHRKPIAIPQTSPSPTAPFLQAYSSDLLAHGITEPTLSAFLTTLSAFISAKVSQQALQHALDIAASLGTYQKDYADRVKSSVKQIGNSAKRLSPLGVIGGTVGLTVGAATHILGSILSTPARVMQKPQPPRARARAYVAAANEKWFHRRGLHALLLDTKELAVEVDASMDSIVQAGSGGSPDVVLGALEKWLASSSVWAGEVDQAAPESSAGAGSKMWRPQLQLGSETLWLVLERTSRKSAP